MSELSFAARNSHQVANAGGNGATSLRTVRIGMLGLGTVGQAVVRVIEQSGDVFRARGIELKLVGALVRDVSKARATQLPAELLTDQPDELLGREIDVAIEALGGADPARALVAKLLRAGTPVVTANKSLMAAAGPALRAEAHGHATSLLCEAAVVAGVPFLGMLARRPLAADVAEITGIFNGTSNYILSAMADEHLPLALALRRAQARGFAEPDATNDVGGVDASEKLQVLLSELAIGDLAPGALEVIGLDGLSPTDLSAARRLGGTIKPLVHASVARGAVAGFVGPAYVPAAHPLSRIENEQNAVLVAPRIGAPLLFSGPGAGPEVTAAAILDDVAEITLGSKPRRSAAVQDAGDDPITCHAPDTPWMLRLTFDAAVPAPREIAEFLGSHGLWFARTSQAVPEGDSSVLHGLVHAASRVQVELALSALRHATGGATHAIRALEVRDV